MTHVQLYSRHLHYNEPSKATGQFKNMEGGGTAANIHSKGILELLIHLIIIFFQFACLCLNACT